MQNEVVQASVITIGDELMIGQVIDTNSAWIAQQLNREGIWIRKRVSVGDNFEEIWRVLEEEEKLSKVILITGGLGPTADDITKPLLCKFFDSTLITDVNVLNHVQHLFENVFKRPFTELNRRQAEVPAACRVIHNARGTAPGMLFEKNGVIFISMPGVPHEMKGMMTDQVLSLLREKFSGNHILHKTLLTAGIGESALAEHIAAYESSLPSDVKLAYLPSYGMVRLRLTATGSNADILETRLSQLFSGLKDQVAQWLVTDEDLTMPQVISKLLKQKGRTLCTAESCTGGHIAHLITTEPGASAIFRGSIVAYSNEVKTSQLGVDPEIIAQNGAVSEHTVTAMLKGALNALKADYAIATSGIMGPDGGTDTKPVGTVWIAAGSIDNFSTLKLQLRFDRMRNIEVTAIQALNLLRKTMSNH